MSKHLSTIVSVHLGDETEVSATLNPAGGVIAPFATVKIRGEVGTADVTVFIDTIEQAHELGLAVAKAKRLLRGVQVTKAAAELDGAI